MTKEKRYNSKIYLHPTAANLKTAERLQKRTGLVVVVSDGILKLVAPKKRHRPTEPTPPPAAA